MIYTGEAPIIAIMAPHTWKSLQCNCINEERGERFQDVSVKVRLLELQNVKGIHILVQSFIQARSLLSISRTRILSFPFFSQIPTPATKQF